MFVKGIVWLLFDIFWILGYICKRNVCGFKEIWGSCWFQGFNCPIKSRGVTFHIHQKFDDAWGHEGTEPCNHQQTTILWCFMEYYRGLPLPFYRSCWAVKFMIFQFISVYYSFMECCGGLCLWFYRGWWVWNASVLAGSKKYPNFPDPFQTPNSGYFLGFQTPNLGYVLGFHTPKFGVWFRRSKRYRRPTKTSFKVVRINNLWHTVFDWNTHLGYILNKIWCIFWTRFGVYVEQNLGYIITKIVVYYNKNWGIYTKFWCILNIGVYIPQILGYNCLKSYC